MHAANTTAHKMIKVDHAGENGAVNIYRAQRLVAHIRARHLLGQLAEFQAHEEEHRQIFSTYLANNNIRRCISYHFTGLGGFTLGIVTGVIGPSAIAATTYAVENVVLEHLEHQMSFLIDDELSAYAAVSKIYQDEKEHHDTAKSQMQDNELLSRVLVRIVKICTEAVIRFGMR